MRLVRIDMRDQIASQKNGRELVMALQGIQAAELSKNQFGEIFGVARFPTFSTVSTHDVTSPP